MARNGIQRIVLHDAAIRAFLKSPELQRAVRDVANEIADDVRDDMPEIKVTAREQATRTVQIVGSDAPEANFREAETGILARAASKGRN